MVTRVDRLQVHLEATGASSFTASLDGAAGAVRQVDTATRSGRQSVLAQADAARDAARAHDELARAERETAEAAKSSDRASRDLAKSLRDLGVAATVTAILKQTVEAISAYEALDARLEAVTGSQSAARDAMVLTEAAARGTSVSVLEMGEAYTTLRRTGLAPTLESLTAVVNMSAATGRSVREVAGDIGNALDGNLGAFENLGVAAERSGDQIRLTFRGVTTDIENSAGAILGYLNEIGNHGYGDAAARQAATLGGAWDELKGSAGELADAIGDGGVGAALRAIVGLATSATEGLERFLRTGEGLQQQTSTRLAAWMLGAQDPYDAARAEAARLANERANAESERAIELAERRAGVEAAVGAAVDAVMPSLEQRAAAEKSNADAAQAMIDRLHDQSATYGLSRAAAIEYTAAQQAAATTDKALAAEIVAAGKALADKVRAQDAATEAAKRTGAAQREQVARERELRAALAESARAYATYMRELMGEEEAMIRSWREAADESDQLRQAVDDLADSFDPAAAGMRRMIEAELVLEKAYKAGIITLEQYDALLEQVFQRQEQLGRGNSLATVWASFTGGSQQDAERSVEQMGESFSRMFADALRSGFKDADKDIGGWLSDLFAGALAESINNKVVKNIAGWAGGGQLNTGDLAAGAAQIGGTYIGGDVGGGSQGSFTGAAAGAQAGAMIGSMFGPWGTVIGAVLGGIIGGIIGADDPPEFDARGPDARNFAGQEGYAVGPYGAVGVSTKDTDVVAAELAQAIVALDQTIASLLTAEENRRVREALADFSVNNSMTAGQILAQRLDEIIREVEPGWINFLTRYEDVQERAAAFGALRGIEDKLDAIDNIAHQLAGDTLALLADELTQLGDDVETAMDAFRTAWESGEAIQIEATAATAMQAIVDRYNAEVQLVHDLMDAIEEAQQQAYALKLTLEQRIAGITGDWGGAVQVTGERMGTLRDAVVAAQTAQQALNLLNQFVGVVDQWVSARQSQINAELQAGLADIEQRRAAAQYSAQLQQQRDQAANEARQREIAALQEQLRLAQEWLSILERADAQQQAMQFGSANPLSGFGRLDAITQAINAMTGGWGANQRLLPDLTPGQAGELLALLEQRLQLIQSEGLFDRPSDDYLAQYNETLRLIDLVRTIAGPGAETAEDLQRRIADLQAQMVDVSSSGFSSANASLSNLAAEEAALRAEAQRQLDELNQQALEQYEWARGQAEENEDARTTELREQLELLTGGLDVQEFIALRQQESTDLLREIERNLREFLAYVEVAEPWTQAPGGSETGPGSGSIPPGSNDEGSNSIVVPITVNMVGSDLTSAAAGQAIAQEVLRIVPLIRRELDVA